jgi:hypothetical protein
MTEQREPLWAGGLAHQPRHSYDEVFPEPADTETPLTPRTASTRYVVILGTAVLIALTILGVSLSAGTSLTVVEVGSAWEGIPMTCHTARLEQGDRALELFSCHAIGGGELPPGVYEPPDAQWTSDLTGADALRNRIAITAEGDLAGWALY